MTDEERERFYDEEIAPALMDLCKRCHDNGLSFLAAVEYAPGDVGRTSAFVDGYGHAMSNALASIAAGDNADSLIMHLMRKGKEYGHSSACLFQLGVPLKAPETAA